jgi:hypothetical protein
MGNIDCATTGVCRLMEAAPHAAYAYVLGQYLGDGHIVHHRRGVYRLEISCCTTYPCIGRHPATCSARLAAGSGSSGDG